MGSPRYTQEFKEAAAKQVLEGGHPAKEVAIRLGIAEKSIYNWVKQVKRSTKPPVKADKESIELLQEEIKKLKSELKRTQEERDILKKATAYFARASE